MSTDSLVIFYLKKKNKKLEENFAEILFWCIFIIKLVFFYDNGIHAACRPPYVVHSYNSLLIMGGSAKTCASSRQPSSGCGAKCPRVRKCQNYDSWCNWSSGLSQSRMITSSLISGSYSFFHRTPVSVTEQDGRCWVNEQLFNILFSPNFSMCSPRPYLLHTIETLLWRQNC